MKDEIYSGAKVVLADPPGKLVEVFRVIPKHSSQTESWFSYLDDQGMIDWAKMSLIVEVIEP